MGGDAQFDPDSYRDSTINPDSSRPASHQNDSLTLFLKEFEI